MSEKPISTFTYPGGILNEKTYVLQANFISIVAMGLPVPMLYLTFITPDGTESDVIIHSRNQVYRFRNRIEKIKIQNAVIGVDTLVFFSNTLEDVIIL
jgi:hypothetical protein